MRYAAGVVGAIGLVVRHPTMHDVGNFSLRPGAKIVWNNN
jgi:hypothetical protein